MHCMIFQMFSDSPQKNLKNNLLPDGLIIIYSCMNCVSFPVSIYLLVFTFYSINSYLMQKLLDIMLFSWEHLVTYIHLSSVWQTLRHIYVHLALRSASAVELLQAPPACSSSPNAPSGAALPTLAWAATFRMEQAVLLSDPHPPLPRALQDSASWEHKLFPGATVASALPFLVNN